MAKAKIKIVSVNKKFTQSEMDKIRRILNCLEGCNFSVSVEINESTPVEITDYIMPGADYVKKAKLRKLKTA